MQSIPGGLPSIAIPARAEDHCPHFSRGFDYPLKCGPVCNNGLDLNDRPIPCPYPRLICQFKEHRIIPDPVKNEVNPGCKGPRARSPILPLRIIT